MLIVSGIQPTGNLHLGNYLGAIKQWVEMQDELAAAGNECLFFLADLHAITVFATPAEMRENVRDMAAALIASWAEQAAALLEGGDRWRPVRRDPARSEPPTDEVPDPACVI